VGSLSWDNTVSRAIKGVCVPPTVASLVNRMDIHKSTSNIILFRVELIFPVRRAGLLYGNISLYNTTSTVFGRSTIPSTTNIRLYRPESSGQE